MSHNSSVLPEASLPWQDILPASATSLKSPFLFVTQQLQRQRLQHVQRDVYLVLCSLSWFNFAYRIGGSIHQKWKHSQWFTIGLFIVVQLPLTKHLDIQLFLVYYKEHDSKFKGVCSGQGGEYHYLYKSLQWSDYSWCWCVAIVWLSQSFCFFISAIGG